MAHMYFTGNDHPKPRAQPSSAYEGTNGFLNARPPEFNPTIETPEWAALDAHRTAQYILTQKDRPIPTMEQMREALKEDTQESIMKRIADLEAQHLDDLQRMYAWHAEEYLQDAHDLYLSYDPSCFAEDKDRVDNDGEARNDMSTFLEEFRRYIPQQFRWTNELEHLRYAHVTSLNSLYSELHQLQAREEQERKRLEADFPLTIEEYNSKPDAVKLRVARYLHHSANPARSEKLLNEFGWAARQVKPLTDIYKKNDRFKSEIVTKLMEIPDPRQR
ncbi:hypothetical protein H0H92_010317 [Tricholoma furcatifolium]|nr:hypothetical protein H0H92_010317 [Tricholoma furcatifolium]